MTKQEAIKKAYGFFYEKVSPSDDGWISYDDWFKYIGHKIEYEYQDTAMLNVRPISLKGIENNNGWIKIESEEQYDQLENGYYEWYNIDTKRYCKGDLWEYGTFTHYKPILKSEPPLH